MLKLSSYQELIIIELPTHYQKSLSNLKFVDLFAGIGEFQLLKANNHQLSQIWKRIT